MRGADLGLTADTLSWLFCCRKTITALAFSPDGKYLVTGEVSEGRGRGVGVRGAGGPGSGNRGLLPLGFTVFAEP